MIWRKQQAFAFLPSPGLLEIVENEWLGLGAPRHTVPTGDGLQEGAGHSPRQLGIVQRLEQMRQGNSEQAGLPVLRRWVMNQPNQSIGCQHAQLFCQPGRL